MIDATATRMQVVERLLAMQHEATLLKKNLYDISSDLYQAEIPTNLWNLWEEIFTQKEEYEPLPNDKSLEQWIYDDVEQYNFLCEKLEKQAQDIVLFKNILVQTENTPSPQNRTTVNTNMKAFKFKAPDIFVGTKDKRTVQQFLKQVQNHVTKELQADEDELPRVILNLTEGKIRERLTRQWDEAIPLEEQNTRKPTVDQMRTWLHGLLLLPNQGQTLRDEAMDMTQRQGSTNAFDTFQSNLLDVNQRLELMVPKQHYDLRTLKGLCVRGMHTDIKVACSDLISDKIVNDDNISYDKFTRDIHEQAVAKLLPDHDAGKGGRKRGAPYNKETQPYWKKRVASVKGGKSAKGGKGKGKGKGKGGKAGKGGTSVCYYCAKPGHYKSGCLHLDSNKDSRPDGFRVMTEAEAKTAREAANIA